MTKFRLDTFHSNTFGRFWDLKFLISPLVNSLNNNIQKQISYRTIKLHVYYNNYIVFQTTKF